MTNPFESQPSSFEAERRKLTFFQAKIYKMQKDFESGLILEEDYQNFKEIAAELLSAYCIVDEKGSIRIKPTLSEKEKAKALDDIEKANELAGAVFERNERRLRERKAG